MNKRFLFVCGTPRSGTTALTEMLNKHSRVAIGIERYKSLPAPELVPDAFTRQRFFDQRAGDTNVARPLDYERLSKKYDDVDWVGDKVPRYYAKYGHLFEAFPDCRIVFVMRHIDRVASSWNARANNPADNWPAENDYRRAVPEWNQSLKLTSKFLEKYPEQLLVVEYERIFSDDGTLYALLDELELSMEAPLLEFWNRSAQRVRKAGRSTRSADQVVFLEAHADWGLYANLRAQALPRPPVAATSAVSLSR